jgi:hypothetical protein
MVIDTAIAEDAARLIQADRQADYGTPEENLGRISALWSAYLGTEVYPEDVSAMMVLLKISRMKAGYKRDNTVDGVAYLLLADMFGRYGGK